MVHQWFFCCLLFAKPKSALLLSHMVPFCFWILPNFFRSCVSAMIKYMSVRDDFGTPSWYRGDFWNVSVLWEKVTTEWPPGQFPSSFSSKRNKDYLKVGYIVLCQKKRRKFNLQTGGWECGLWFRIKVMQLVWMWLAWNFHPLLPLCGWNLHIQSGFERLSYLLEARSTSSQLAEQSTCASF